MCRAPVTVTLDGLEDLVASIVDERVRAALAGRKSDGWLTSDEAAEYLGVARSTIHDAVCDGLLPRHGPKGSRLRFKRADLDSYAEGRRRT